MIILRALNTGFSGLKGGIDVTDDNENFMTKTYTYRSIMIMAKE